MAAQQHQEDPLPFPANSSPQSCHLQKFSDHNVVNRQQTLKYRRLVDDFVGLLLQIKSSGTEQRQVKKLIGELSLLWPPFPSSGRMSKLGCSHIYTSECNRLQWAGNTARCKKCYSWFYVLQRLRGSHLFNTMLQMVCWSVLASICFHAALCRGLTKNSLFPPDGSGLSGCTHMLTWVSSVTVTVWPLGADFFFLSIIINNLRIWPNIDVHGKRCLLRWFR